MSPPRVATWPLPATPGQLQLASLVMGAGTPYGVETIEGLDLPDIVSAETPRAGTDGTFGGIDTMAKRTLLLHLLLHPDTVQRTPSKALLLRNLKAAFDETSDLVGLTYNDPDLGGLLFMGRPRRVASALDLTRAMLSQEALAQFDALDPLIYSATLQDVLIAYGTAGTNAGLPFNASALAGMTFQQLRYIQNGGFESASPTDGGWLTSVATDLAAGAVLTRDTGTFHGGVAAGKLVTSGSSTNQGVRQSTLVNLLPSTSYTFSVWVNLSTAGGSIRLLARDVTNAVLASSAAVVNTTGTWQQLSVVLVTGATGPVQVALSVRDEGTAVARTFFVDDVRADLSSAVQAWAAPLAGATFGPIGGGAGAAGFQQCVNNGNQPSQPVTRIKAPLGAATGPLHLSRVESGQDIMLNYSMQPGDVLELDHDLHTVTLNGVTNRADVVDASTSWWPLQPGINTIHYRTEGPGVGSSAEVLWRDAWL